MRRIIVSDDFINCYLNFNVYNQIENIKKLSTQDIYFLLIISFSLHDHENPIVFCNYSEFEREIRDILSSCRDNVDSDNILRLKKYLEVDNLTDFRIHFIYDKNGKQLPNIYTKKQVREIHLNNILEK